MICDGEEKRLTSPISARILAVKVDPIPGIVIKYVPVLSLLAQYDYLKIQLKVEYFQGLKLKKSS